MSSDSSKTGTISVSRSRARLIRAGGILSLALALITACAALALAQDPRNTTRADLDQWLAKYGDAKPDFKPGDVLTVKDFERIRPFMMPGYVEQFKFPGMRMEIIPTRSHMPRKDYMDCTEKYQAQVKIESRRLDGKLLLRPAFRGCLAERRGSAVGIQGGVELRGPMVELRTDHHERPVPL